MARMVDVDALIKAMRVHTYMQTEWTPATAWGVPIVDAVEVVRCKDCRYCVPFRNRASGMCERKYEWYDVVENIQECFCSWGERREDEVKQDD